MACYTETVRDVTRIESDSTQPDRSAGGKRTRPPVTISPTAKCDIPADGIVGCRIGRQRHRRLQLQSRRLDGLHRERHERGAAPTTNASGVATLAAPSSLAGIDAASYAAGVTRPFTADATPTAGQTALERPLTVSKAQLSVTPDDKSTAYDRRACSPGSRRRSRASSRARRDCWSAAASGALTRGRCSIPAPLRRPSAASATPYAGDAPRSLRRCTSRGRTPITRSATAAGTISHQQGDHGDGQTPRPRLHSACPDAAAHGATGTATGVNGEALSGLDLGASFTNVPGGTAAWTFTDVTGNYNDTAGTVAIVINKANATVNVEGFAGVYDGQAHGATGTATGVNGEALGGLDFGTSFTNVPGGTAAWTFNDATGNYNDTAGNVAIVINKADATVFVDGYGGTYDGQAHGATGTATGVNGETLSGLDLGTSFTNVPGGTAAWTFTDVTGNYNDTEGNVAIVIDKADQPSSSTATGASTTLRRTARPARRPAWTAKALSGLALGDSFTNVPGGTAIGLSPTPRQLQQRGGPRDRAPDGADADDHTGRRQKEDPWRGVHRVHRHVDGLQGTDTGTATYASPRSGSGCSGRQL